MEPKKEFRSNAQANNRELITSLNQTLAAINKGQMPGVNREEVLARKRVLEASHKMSRAAATRPAFAI